MRSVSSSGAWDATSSLGLSAPSGPVLAGASDAGALDRATEGVGAVARLDIAPREVPLRPCSFMYLAMDCCALVYASDFRRMKSPMDSPLALRVPRKYFCSSSDNSGTFG